MKEPQIGPNKKPIPVAISTKPMFCSLSLGFELEITMAIEATELTPEPSPPMSWAAKDQIMKVVGFLNSVKKYSNTYYAKIKSIPTMMAISRPIMCKYLPPMTHEII